MAEQYITILEDSLRRKKEVLDEIIKKNEEQKAILDAKEFDIEAFDKNTEEKGALIDKLNLLDSGFEKIYEHVKEELAENREKYTEQIKRMQELIRDVTERSVSIQADEQRNRSKVEARFREEREKIQLGKSSMKVAKQYYNNMNKISGGSGSVFFDGKK